MMRNHMSDEHTGNDPSGLRPEGQEGESIWLRLVFTVVYVVLFGLAEAVLLVMTVLQFAFLLFTRKPNAMLADFGQDLSDWLRAVARYQTGVSADKPFPFG